MLVVIESEARVEVEDWDSKLIRLPGIEEGVVLAVHDLVVGVLVEDVLVVEAFEELELVVVSLEVAEVVRTVA